MTLYFPEILPNIYSTIMQLTDRFKGIFRENTGGWKLEYFLQPIMRKFIGCKNVAHHKNIFLSLSVLSWAHSSPCPLGLCGIAKKIRQSTMWREIVEKEGAFDPRASILTYLSMSPLSIDYSTKAMKVFNQCPNDGWKIKTLEYLWSLG